MDLGLKIQRAYHMASQGHFRRKYFLIFENRFLIGTYPSREAVFSRFLALVSVNLDDFFYKTKILNFPLDFGCTFVQRLFKNVVRISENIRKSENVR